MKKNTTPSVLSLNDIKDYSVDQAADAIAERHQARSRAFVENGKLVHHLENVVGLPKQQTVYGIMKKRGVPEGSVHNARVAANFISAFVVPGLLTEKRADEIITHRICRMTDRILNGKSTAKLTAEELVPLLKSGKKDAIGDELDCLDEHGCTIAERDAAEKAKRAEADRLAKQQAAAAAATEAPAPENEAEPTAPQSAASGEEATSEAPAPAPAKGEAPAAEPAKPAVSGEAPQSPTASPAPVTVDEVLAEIGKVELKSYDLDEKGMAAVQAKLKEWAELLGTSIQSQKKSDKAASRKTAKAA